MGWSVPSSREQRGGSGLLSNLGIGVIRERRHPSKSPGSCGKPRGKESERSTSEKNVREEKGVRREEVLRPRQGLKGGAREHAKGLK